MKSSLFVVATLCIAIAGMQSAYGQLYWDIDGAIDGAGGMTPSGIWDSSTPNWNTDSTGGAGVISTWDNTSATFSAGSDATGDYTISVDGTQSVSGIIFDSGSATLNDGILSLTGSPSTIQVDDSVVATINSELQGAGLTKTGTGTLVLNGANSSFTGTITVSNGILAIPSGGPATVLGSVGLLGQTATAANNTVVNNGATVQITGTYNGADQFLIRGDGFNGGGALRKVGADETIYLGLKGVTLNGGSARITSADAGGTLVFRSGNFGRNTTTGPPTLTFDGDGDIRTTAVADGGNWNMAISTSRVVKEGSGTLTLGGISSWTGGTTIKGGVVSFSADTTGSGSQQLGVIATDLTLNYDEDNIILDGGTLRSANTGTINTHNNRGMQIGVNGGTVDVPNSAAITVWTSTIKATPDALSAGTATLTKTGPGELRYNANATHTRNETDYTHLVVQQGLFRLGNVTGANTELGFGGAPSVPTDNAITLDGGAIGASFGVTLHDNRGITVAAGGGTINGSSGTLTMPATSATKLTGAGPLTITGNTGNGLILNAPLSDFSGDLIVNGLFTMGANVSLNVESLSGNASGLGRITVASNQMLTFGSDDSSTSYNGRIAGAGGFTKTGAGTFTIATENYTNTGPTIINGGVILLNDSLAGLGNSSTVTVDTGATFQMDAINDTIGALAGSGTVSRTTGNLTLAAASGDTTFDGQITGTGTLTKSGGAIQRLSGANSFGDVTVSGGSLILNGANTTGAVAVNSGTLGGNGSVTGSIAVNSGGHLAPGESAGKLTAAGATFAAGSFFDIELGGLTPITEHDQFALTGGATIDGGTLALSLINGFMPSLGNSFEILTATGGVMKNVDFTIDATNAPAPDGTAWQVNYGLDSVLLSLVEAGLPGDFNLDMVVDAADYVVWRKDPGSHGGPAGYDLWRANFGNPSGSGSGLSDGGSVPEPAAGLLLVLAAGSLTGWRRRR